MADPLIPPNVFRNEAMRRSMHGRHVPLIGCGLMTKPGLGGSYRNRILEEYLVAVYVIRGTGRFHHWSGEDHRVSAGDMIIMPPGPPHGVTQDPDGQWVEAYLELDGGFSRELLRLGVLSEETPVIHPGVDLPLIQRFERLLDDLTHLPDYALPFLMIQPHELLNAAMQLHRQQQLPGRHQQLIESACLLLSQNLHAPLDIAEVAAKLDMSYERFRKLFRQRIGTSPGSYRIRRRIDRALALLSQHRLSNKQIAYELGYPDPFTFSKQFRKVTGQWPDDCRRSSAGEQATR